MEHGRILLVENDLILAWDLTEALEGAGYEVCAVRSGAEGARAAHVWHPDLAIVDENVTAPDGDDGGVGLYVPAVIRLTVLSALHEGQRASGEIVNKPFLQPALLAKVAQMLNRSRPEPIPCGMPAAAVEAFV